MAASAAVSLYMNTGAVAAGSPLHHGADSMISVADLQIFPAEISGVPVQKFIIHAGYSVILDAVAGGNIDLHTIVRYKVVAASSHDFVGGIVEQVIGIKFQYMIRGQIVVKKAGRM